MAAAGSLVGPWTSRLCRVWRFRRNSKLSNSRCLRPGARGSARCPLRFQPRGGARRTRTSPREPTEPFSGRPSRCGEPCDTVPRRCSSGPGWRPPQAHGRADSLGRGGERAGSGGGAGVAAPGGPSPPAGAGLERAARAPGEAASSGREPGAAGPRAAGRVGAAAAEEGQLGSAGPGSAADPGPRTVTAAALLRARR